MTTSREISCFREQYGLYFAQKASCTALNPASRCAASPVVLKTIGIASFEANAVATVVAPGRHLTDHTEVENLNAGIGVHRWPGIGLDLLHEVRNLPKTIDQTTRVRAVGRESEQRVEGVRSALEVDHGDLCVVRV